MYRPDKDHPEGWIHRDKLAKIESEELQAAGINLANARSRSQSRIKNERPEQKKDERKSRLQSPVEMEDESESTAWDPRLPEEIDADTHAASMMYANPVLRKSGSKIPVLAASPLPVPAERYERETPMVRKRAASGNLSIEGDLHVAKIRNSVHKSPEESDTSSKTGSPEKQRSKSATLSPGPTPKVDPAIRKASAPIRATPSPNQRPPTRSGEDRPRTAVNRPEGDPPWLATMYKPDPRLPPDQQLIPTLAKKQMQAQWAEEGAIPTTYDRNFTPVAVLDDQAMAKEAKRRSLTPAPIMEERREEPEPQFIDTRPALPRPGTSGSVTGAYSTMPKVVSPMRQSSTLSSPTAAPVMSPVPSNAGRPAAAPPTRMQATSLADDDDEKVKKGCCCIVM